MCSVCFSHSALFLRCICVGLYSYNSFISLLCKYITLIWPVIACWHISVPPSFPCAPIPKFKLPNDRDWVYFAHCYVLVCKKLFIKWNVCPFRVHLRVAISNNTILVWMLFPPSTFPCHRSLDQGSATFFHKGPDGNISGLAGHMVCLIATQTPSL